MPLFVGRRRVQGRLAGLGGGTTRVDEPLQQVPAYSPTSVERRRVETEISAHRAQRGVCGQQHAAGRRVAAVAGPLQSSRTFLRRHGFLLLQADMDQVNAAGLDGPTQWAPAHGSTGSKNVSRLPNGSVNDMSREPQG